MSKEFRFLDLFCGGGGSVTGAINALNAAGMQYEGRGFNHWPIAIKTIQMNHPEVIPDFAHACASIKSVTPDEIFDDDPTRIDAIWASPACTHHSRAKGGKPRSKQLREQPEYLLPYIRLTKCRRLYVENVEELKEWGPVLDRDLRYKGKLYRAGTPDPRYTGKYFDLWIREIKASGYKVDIQIMNAADYGAVTSRRRLIVQAVRKSSGERIIWPDPTHSKEPNLFDCKPWRSAAEIIDWSIVGESIFERKKPLCENTLRRIESGIRKYWGDFAEPFLVILRGTSEKQLESSALPVSGPVPTITAGGEHIALIQPLFVDQSHPGDKKSDDSRCKVGPLGTITTTNNWSVVRPLFIPQHGGGAVKPCDMPLSTIATTGSIGIVRPFLIDYHGASKTQTLDKPINTIRTHDRFGLIQGQILELEDGRKFKLDITHRMLTAKELAAATGFPRDYVFAGKDTDAKKQIGNAVCPDVTAALYRAFLAA